MACNCKKAGGHMAPIHKPKDTSKVEMPKKEEPKKEETK